MPARKVEDEGEVLQWFEEGRIYALMFEEYRRKYSVNTVRSMWANFCRRRDLDHRIIRDADLIPWSVSEEHRYKYPWVCAAPWLASERARAAPTTNMRSRSGRRNLGDDVVHDAPTATDGFSYVRRTPGGDDVIREPARKTTLRSNAESRSR